VKNRRNVVEVVSWCACFFILAGLFLGLDSYKRVPIEYGYGPDRRAYLSATLETAGQLQESGSVELQPEDQWHLLGGWEDELTPAVPPRALAVHRRARFVLPVFQPDTYQIRIHVRPVPPPGRESWTLELELGVNGVSGGRFAVPPEGAVLTLRVVASSLFRGDNVAYLYRITRRSDPGPWASVGRIDVERTSSSP
jgi:hypothetical protein